MAGLIQHFNTLLLDSLSNIFSKAQSTNIYKILFTVSNELDIADTNLDELRQSISLTQASSGDLDLFGFQMNLRRINGEEDELYRQRLLASYDREYITKNNLQNLSTDYSISVPKIEEYIYDRWWLGGTPIPQSQEEISSSSTTTTVNSSSGVLINTIPDCFLITDTTYTGTNFCSGCTFTNTISGAIITLTTPVSAGTQMRIRYVPNQATSGDNIDWIPHSFAYNDTIIRHRNSSNNYGIINSTSTYIQIQTNMLPGYLVYSSYTDIETGIIYSWTSIVEQDGTIFLREENRTDNLITNEFQISNDENSVITNYEIGRVLGVYLATDVTQKDTNYATDNNFQGRTIILNTPLQKKSGVIVTYNKFSIRNYSLLSSNLLTRTGEEDLRFTIEIQITQDFIKYGTFKYNTARWGQLQNELTGTLGQLIDIAKAAGIKTSVILVSKGVHYGDDEAIYAQCWYGGAYY
jgi:hypothetical protein